MADLTNIPLDPNVQETTGGYTVIPPGNYEAVIVGDELRDNKAGTGKVLKLRVQITKGPHAGEVIDDYLNIVNANATAQSIGQGTLKRICGICGVQYPPADTTALYGRPMTVKVVNEEFVSSTTGETLKSNKIKSYSPVQQGQAQPNPNTGGGAW